MTPVELLIAAIAILWVLGNTTVDAMYAARGKASPRLLRARARFAAAQGGQQRYGARQYFADAMSDFWRDKRARREARRAGATPPPRRQGRIGRALGGVRGRVTGWWDRATTRVDQRRAEAIQDQERLHTTRRQRVRDRLLGWPDATASDQQRRQWEEVADRSSTEQADRRPGGDFADRANRPAADQRAGGPGTAPAAQDPPSAGPPPAPNQPAPPGQQQSQQSKSAQNGRQYVTQPVNMPTGETTGVISGSQQAQQIRLAATSLRESTLGHIDQLIQQVDAQEAAAAEMKMDDRTLADLAQAREALTSLKTAVNGAGDEVDGAMGGVQKDWEKHLPGVELNQATGGLAERRAYEN